MRCQYRDCTNPADICIVVGGERYHLCRKHWIMLCRLLDRIMERRNEISLEELKVYTRDGRITRIRV